MWPTASPAWNWGRRLRRQTLQPKELEARIRCVLRRVEKEGEGGTIPNSGIIQVGDLRIDTNKRQVYRSDERIRLTGMEFSLLELLVSRCGEPFSRGEILKEVWGYTPERHVDTTGGGCSYLPAALQTGGRSGQPRADPHGSRHRLFVPTHR
jgi:hypothetical protein